VLIPVADALHLFNRDGLSRIVVRAHSAEALGAATAATRAVLKERHDGDEDFTIIDPGTVLAALNRVLGFVTTAVALIAGISLVVGGVMITNLQLVAVAERTGEVGLRRAVGARKVDIALQFMIEALLLAMFGCAAGWGLAALVGESLRRSVPQLPIAVTAWSAELAFVFCAVVGILAGIYPAIRAANLDPATALAKR
jgi:putative ABC transport system permease protein